eukprot:g3862.t1
MTDISLKVGIRTRPCVPLVEGKDDVDDDGPRLGVGHSLGKVHLHNMKVAKKNYGFTYSWWTAYNWQKFFKDTADIEKCHEIEKYCESKFGAKVAHQLSLWEECGLEMMEKVVAGHSVVLFAYGLSGSGKTYSVFGVDAPKDSWSWYYQTKGTEPETKHWGIFPRLVYTLYQNKTDKWKFKIKYFQNVVNIVIDLLSPTGEQKSYKDGMRKDKDGFMDIPWCTLKTVPTWTELCNTFAEANKKKAIAATQFNHQSTRGHCILLCEVEIPDPDIEGKKNLGRIYVCDLAGSEPAATIYSARYKKVIPDPSEPDNVEYKCIGEGDPKKTKILRAQGTAINQSLVELGMFFKKMAIKIKKGKLKPGASVPGCNSTFLGKYLKKTILQANTYLFCAVRPEARFKRFTLATLQFAENASVIKVKPVKASAALTPLEAKLMKQIEEMKEAMAHQQKEENQVEIVTKDMSAEEKAKYEKQLEEQKRQHEEQLKQLRESLEKQQDSEKDKSEAEAKAKLQAKRDELKERGMTLSFDAVDCAHPYLLSMAEEAHKSGNYMVIFDQEKKYSVGPEDDIQPFTYNCIDKHAHFERKGNKVFVVGGVGQTVVNGKGLAKDESHELKLGDRVVIGGEMYRFEDKSMFESEGKTKDDLMNGEEILDEFQSALRSGKAHVQGSNSKDEANKEIAAMRKQMEQEREAWLQEQKAKGEKLKADEISLREKELLAKEEAEEVLISMQSEFKEMATLLEILDRGFLQITPILYANISMDTGRQDLTDVRPKITITDTQTNERAMIDPYMFKSALATIKGEITKLKLSMKKEEDYSISPANDPVSLLFDTTFLLGQVNFDARIMGLNMKLDEEERQQDIIDCLQPYGKKGFLKLSVYPCNEDGEEIPQNKLPKEMIFDDPNEMVGKSWRYAFEINHLGILPLKCDEIFCEYRIFGETFKTEVVEHSNSNETDMDYKQIHFIESMTQEQVDALANNDILVRVYVNPYIDPELRKRWTSLSTSTDVIAKNLKCPPVNYEKKFKNSQLYIKSLLERIKELEKENEDLLVENEKLKVALQK